MPDHRHALRQLRFDEALASVAHRGDVLVFLPGNAMGMHTMDASTVASKGQVTIPKAIRRELGIGQGSRVAFACKNGKIELRVPHRAPVEVESGLGMLGARGKKLAPDFDAASLLIPKPSRKGRTRPAAKR